MRAVASLAWLTIKGRPYGFIAAFVAVLAGAARWASSSASRSPRSRRCL